MSFGFYGNPLAPTWQYPTKGSGQQTIVVGPVSPGLDTTLTNKKAGPFTAKSFSKKDYLATLSALGNETGLPSGLAERELAERRLERAQKAHDIAIEGKYNTARTEKALLEAQKVVKAFKLKDDVEAAKEKIRQQVKDAIAKRRGH